MPTIRCSSLPLALTCPASQVPPAIQTEGDDAAARLGSAVHQLLADAIESGGLLDWQFALAAARWRVEESDLTPLAWAGWRCWLRLAEQFPDPSVEVALRAERLGWELTGHADVISATDSDVRLLDWKSGREDSDYDDQLRGYALLALEQRPAVDRAYVAVVRLREQQVDGRWYNRAELDAWWQGCVKSLERRDLYRTGSHCGYCRRNRECGAHSAAAAQAIGALLNHDDPTLDMASAAGVALDRVKLVEKVCETARANIAALVVRMGGRLATSDGRELVMTEQARRVIDPKLGLPILREVLAPDQIADCLTISKTKVEAAVGDNAPRGQKGQARQALIDRLDEAGALLTTTIKRLECRRLPAEIEVQQ